MRIFLSTDMDGITGVVHREQLMPEGRDYERARRLMTADINAAIEGALREDPAAEFIVNDGHGNGRNVLLEDLHEAAQLVVGPSAFANRPLCQAQGCDDEIDLAFFVGYHSRAGGTEKRDGREVAGLLAHTWAGAVVCNFYVNGQVVGETGINAAVVGHFDVPVGLISGASDLAAEAGAIAGAVFVQTKQTLGKTAAICLPPDKSLPLITEGAAEAVRRLRAGKLAPIRPALPVTFKVECWRREMAQKAATTPGVKQTGELSVECEAPTVLQAATIMWDAMGRAQLEEAAWLK